jgi:phosphoribosylaminoimidazole-succinocarboxamide synthase
MTESMPQDTPDPSGTVLFQSRVDSLPCIHRGKVRDLYAVDAAHLLMVTTDRLSAFDCVLPTPIPHKGWVLSRLSSFWFARLAHLVPNHLTGIAPESVVTDAERPQVLGRAVVVKKMQALPFEAVVRGYLEGSGWKQYQASGAVCGIVLPAGLKRAERLARPIFTPSTKAPSGAHDENVSFDTMAERIGMALAVRIRDTALALYAEAAAYALSRGIIIADTKFEFGLDQARGLHLIDEALTPDSSRFWPLASYAPGSSPESFDKQYVRNWLERSGWNHQAPAPALPPDVVSTTADKYLDALHRLTVADAIHP